MLNVLTARVHWPLNRDDVFIFACTTLEHEPIDMFDALILVPFHEVPPEDEVFCDVVDTVSDHGKGDVVPWHSAMFGLAEFVVLPVFDAFEIHDAVVVEVLSWEYFVLYTGWVHVCQGMLVCIPSSET